LVTGGLLLFVRVSSNSSFQPIPHPPNNARGFLVNISSSLLNVISPTNPFSNVRVSKNFALLPT
jgi:hypothetical protein